MNEQELKEKIARIVAKHLCKNRYSHFQLYGDSANCYSRENFTECEAIADTVDALIAADIGDVSELQKECESKEEAYNKCYSDYRYWKDKAKEYKHRAEVAERAVREYAVQVGCRYCPFYCRCGMDKPNAENDYQECYSAALRIAEKELQEEDK